MIELHGWIVIAWTIMTAILSFASAWGAVKYQQKIFEDRQKEFKVSMKCAEHRIVNLEKTYMSKEECKDKQIDRSKERDYHESNIVQKLDDLKSFIVGIDQKREKTKADLREQLNQIRTDLAVLRTSVEYGPIAGAPKAGQLRTIDHDSA